MINRQKFITQILVTTAIIISLSLCVDSLSDLWVPSFTNIANIQIRYIRRGIEYIFLNIIYVTWLILSFRKNRREEQSYSFIDILKAAAPFLVIAWAAHPQTNDINYYLQFGLMDLHRVNPFIHTTEEFTSKFSLFLKSENINSPYGPVAQIFFAISAYFTQVSIPLGVYIFKLTCLFSHVINAYLIWHLLKSSNHRILIATAYLVNPILLFDTIGNAHIDTFICTSFILFFLCLKHRYYTLGVFAIWMGLLTKVIPVFWLFLLLVFLAQQRLRKSFLIATFLSLAIVAALSLTVLPGYTAWKSLLFAYKWPTAGSLHNILTTVLQNSQGFLPNVISGSKYYRVVIPFKLLAYVGYLMYYAWTLFKIYSKRNYSASNLILDIGWATLFLFLFATPWYMPWYASLLVPMIALSLPIVTSNNNALLFVIVSSTFSLSSTSYYLLALPQGPSFLFGVVSLITVVPPILILVFGEKFLPKFQVLINGNTADRIS